MTKGKIATFCHRRRDDVEHTQFVSSIQIIKFSFEKFTTNGNKKNEFFASDKGKLRMRGVNDMSMMMMMVKQNERRNAR
jgi:hypothetical protein